ncbi:MAG: hypothetical protein KDJ77_20105, partial [Rhodobiaceae bacterium]|nr:hypothetical protein [Rhodobiaceae bacterium]
IVGDMNTALPPDAGGTMSLTNPHGKIVENQQVSDAEVVREGVEVSHDDAKPLISLDDSRETR